jgi:hypothetical protein
MLQLTTTTDSSLADGRRLFPRAHSSQDKFLTLLLTGPPALKQSATLLTAAKMRTA